MYPFVQNHSKSWVARNRFVLNGQIRYFSIPATHGTKSKDIDEIEFVDFESWFTGQLNMFSQAYRKASFFDETMDMLESMQGVAKGTEKSFEVICESVKVVSKHFGLPTQITVSERNPEEEDALRQIENADERRHTRVVRLCQKHGATEYINLPGGRELYDPSRFIQHGLKLNFVDSGLEKFIEAGLDHPDASIIHALMHLGKDRVSELLQRPAPNPAVDEG